MTRVEPPYFPHLTFGDARFDDFMQQWFGRHLLSLDEPRLCSQPIADTIRLLTLPAFAEPTLVRVERHESCTEITSKATDGRGGYGPGWEQVRERDVSLFAEGLQLLEQIGFWSLPVLDDALVLDGTRYVMEANIGGKHHVVERAILKRREARLVKWLCLQSTRSRISP